ncbi:hypothetical protein DQ04_01121110 [Trypanosoma grayi]|uniref:hypothetical protein n=1 Tax=Trypanosoma grayi TaxID=71804 RepID=UPI0004F4A86C|nr:hypothetical protein DQ04_01121110 [Trypanosoma grayi]KEG13256.1 hypothetical protein DQ04_01121110 [Trypanosoma grayi]
MVEPVRVYVGPAAAFKEKSRQLVKCGERNIAVYRYKDQFFALDNACYHHGGPLVEGDIEEMGGHPCVVCPWHEYRITLDTGEGLYWALQLTPAGLPDKSAPQTVRSKGRKQRTHIVTVEDGGVFVTVDTDGPRVDSDTYAEMAIANQEYGMTVPVAEGGRAKGFHSGMRSGHVLAGLASSTKENKLRPECLGGQLVVMCVKVEHVCTGAKEFFFNLCQGQLGSPPLPGQFVDLQLPIAAPAGKRFVRRWTIFETNKDGCLFTIVVKAAANSRGGSAWIHNNALLQRFPLLLLSGCFTLVHHMDRLREVAGRVVVLSAGIGVTAPHGSLRHYIEGKWEKENPQLHVLHLHVERTVSSVARVEDYLRWHYANAAHFTYRFHCYLTQEPPDSVVEDVSLQPLITCGRRPTAEDITSFVSDFVKSAPVLAFVCGPPEFINMGKCILGSLGVAASDMLTDEDDSVEV